MGLIDRGRETHVLAALLRDKGMSATFARARVEDVEAHGDTWTQLRLWLAFTDDDDEVVRRFEVKVGRPREVVSAWGGITEDLWLHMRADAARLRVCVA